MKKKSIFVLFGSFLVLLSSCASDPVRLNIKPKGSEPKVVIYAQITDNEEIEPSYVRVTKSTSFFEPLATPFIDNALVQITDNLGNSWTFDYDKEGYYRPSSALQPIAQGQVYNLSVTVNGTIYSHTATMIPVAPGRKLVDSITYRFREEKEPGIRKDGYYVYLWGGKDEQTAPYLYLKVFRNDSLRTRDMDDDNRQTIFLAESKFFLNKIEGVELPSVYKKGDLVRAVMLSIDKNAYDYLTGISNQMNNAGGLFDGPPANVKSNFTNGALGVFLASSIQWDTLTIK